MAANDYYNTRPSQPQYYNAYDDADDLRHQGAATPASSVYPPSYTTNAPHNNNPLPDRQPTVSPFQTPFDDHVYPTGSHSAADAMSSQHSFAQDTRYHSPAAGDVSPVGDDIPLRQHPDAAASSNKMGSPGYAMDSTDHVYDAPAGGRLPDAERSAGKGRIRFGELGMLGSGKKRIPIFVYLFSIIQIAVFIGEMVKAGAYRFLSSLPVVILPRPSPAFQQCAAANIENSPADRESNPNPAILQPHDRAFLLCPYQYGIEIRHLHASRPECHKL